MKKKITLAISDFAISAPRCGSIDTYSGFGKGSLFGQQVHVEIQQELKNTHENYEPEVWCQHKFTKDNFIFEVIGRMDGIYYQKPLKIEEIKTAFDLKKLMKFLEFDQHPYRLQLQTYGYIHWLKTNELPELNLLLVSSRNKKRSEYPIELELKSYEDWLKQRLADLISEVCENEKRIKRRKKMAGKLVFPFIEPRPSQKELMSKVEEGIKNDKHLLIQAPTGLGKTMGILFPVLTESLSRGQKTIYLTPKNSQHLAALDAVERLQQEGANIKAMTLTAKRKLCLKEEPMCNADYCEFAQDHYTKVSVENLLGILSKQKKLTSGLFRETGETYKVCPYELQMALVKYMDVVICDYNYVFSPRAGGEVGKLYLAETQKANVVVDEIHNLPARGMDYFSPALSVVYIERLKPQLEKLQASLKEKFQCLLEDCISIIKRCGEPTKFGPHKIVPPVSEFKEQENKLREFLSLYLESDSVIGPEDGVIGLFNYWSEFSQALEWVTSGREEFFTSYYPIPGIVKITCCNAAELLKTVYVDYANIVGFSATLKPFEYYSSLIGLQTKKLSMAEFVSPFPPEHRKILIIPQISSKYNDRNRNYPRIADAIKRIVMLKRGNYFAFFPSFEFLASVLHRFDCPMGMEVITQSRGMQHIEVKKIIDRLSNPYKAHIVFAVQGGVFSEGVDYPGDLAIGAFVVGPPLPNFDWEREQLKQYYEKRFTAGMDYAYTFPAMAKAVQAAGRVIRSEKDKGIIVLMDNRFLLPNYSKCMPEDWYKDDPNECISTQILKDIMDFWG